VTDARRGEHRRDRLLRRLPDAAREVQPQALRLRFSATRDRAKGIVGPALSPDGTRVVFQACNQLWLMKIGEAPQQLTGDSYYKCDPSWSPDGKRIAIPRTRRDRGPVRARPRDRGRDRVTSIVGAEGLIRLVAGRLAARLPGPDRGHLRRRPGQRERPAGDRLAVRPQQAQLVQGRQDDRGGRAQALHPPLPRGTSQILTVDVASGVLTYTEPAPFKSISTRGEDGPVYAPDGSAVAFVMESTLWVRPVDEHGVPTGEAKRSTSRSPTPDLSGDSKSLLYLSNGELRIDPPRGRSPTTVAARPVLEAADARMAGSSSTPGSSGTAAARRPGGRGHRHRGQPDPEDPAAPGDGGDPGDKTAASSTPRS
jgi:hypothetical protein